MKFLLLILVLTGCASCVTREQVQAELWNHDQIPANLCVGGVQDYGVYRVLACKPGIPSCDGTHQTYQEVIPYCAARITKMLAADEAKVADWLAQLTKPKN